MVPVPVAAKSRSRSKPRARSKNLGPKVTPQSAAADRDRALEVIGPLVESEPAAAGKALDIAASEKGDPVLYLEAGDAYLRAAEADSQTAYAEAARERARISLDILYFHLDDAADPRFQLVSGTEIPALIDRAEELLAEADAVQTELAAPTLEDADDGDTDPDGKKRKRRRKTGKPGRIMIISGAGSASVGGALLVMGIAGLGVGAARQREAQDPAVYGDQYDAVDRRGRRANAIAGVGLGLGAALVAAGVTLVVLGTKRKKAAASDDTMVRVGPRFDTHGGGVSLSGRF
jgi:hypothetical protein